MDYRRLWLQHVLILTLHKVLDLLCFMCVCDLTKHPSRRPCHHVLTVVQFSDVLTHIGPPDAGVTLDVHVVSQSEQHLHTHERDRANQNPCSCSLMTGWLWWCGRGYLLNLSGQLSGWSEDQCLGLPHLQTGNTSQRDVITCSLRLGFTTNISVLTHLNVL